MSYEQILSRIPHRAPMLLVDEIIDETVSSITCRKTFSADEYFFQGHFPGSPVVPGVIQCECCLQAGAVLLAPESEYSRARGASPADAENLLPLATRMDSVKFKRLIRPGDIVDVEVQLKEQVSNAFYMTGKLMLHGKVATRLDFSVTMSPVPVEMSSVSSVAADTENQG